MTMNKPAHILVLDAGPILRSDPSLSTLQAKCDQLYTTSAIASEIKDPVARSRFENTYLPFLVIRDPKPQSIRIITEYCRKTGDSAVLSRGDIGILALAYELECEKNGGDWRLRSVPGQKRLNGSPPAKISSTASDAVTPVPLEAEQQTSIKVEEGVEGATDGVDDIEAMIANIVLEATEGLDCSNDDATQQPEESKARDSGGSSDTTAAECPSIHQRDSDQEASDSDGWITPANLKKQQVKDSSSESSRIPREFAMQVATLTTDFAMQNVLLQMNLNLISTSLQQICHIRTYILRCHACFETTKDMSKQFCPRCGNPTLTRVSCSTNAKGEFRMYLKKNMQWNSRGDRFSIPKPVAGSANQKAAQMKGGGKGGWGQGLILTEDQKEYTRALGGQGWRKEKNLLDEDSLPGILTGDRSRQGGRPKVGAGRNINSKRRR